MLTISERHCPRADAIELDQPPDECARATEIEIVVDTYCDWLRRVAIGEDRAYHLSHLFDAIARKCAHRGRHPEAAILPPEHRDRLLEALRIAGAANPNMFWVSTNASRKCTEHGFKALGTLIELRSECAEDRARRPAHFLRDALDHARIFQNLMHNVSLTDDIRQRSCDRIAKEVDQIRLSHPSPEPDGRKWRRSGRAGWHD